MSSDWHFGPRGCVVPEFDASKFSGMGCDRISSVGASSTLHLQLHAARFEIGNPSLTILSSTMAHSMPADSRLPLASRPRQVSELADGHCISHAGSPSAVLPKVVAPGPPAGGWNGNHGSVFDKRDAESPACHLRPQRLACRSTSSCLSATFSNSPSIC